MVKKSGLYALYLIILGGDDDDGGVLGVIAVGVAAARFAVDFDELIADHVAADFGSRVEGEYG